MNADGTPGVRTRGRFGVEVPHLPALLAGVLGAGFVLLAAGGVTAYAARPRRLTTATPSASP